MLSGKLSNIHRVEYKAFFTTGNYEGWRIQHLFNMEKLHKRGKNRENCV
jgi:hypothetical protein